MIYFFVIFRNGTLISGSELRCHRWPSENTSLSKWKIIIYFWI